MTIMTTIDFITELFFRVDNKVDDDKHPQAKLYPSEVVTLALLYGVFCISPKKVYFSNMTPRVTMSYIQ